MLDNSEIFQNQHSNTILKNNYISNSNSNLNSNINTINSKIPYNINETIIKFNIDDINNIEKENIKKNVKYNISPIIRKTPNTKAEIIIQKIYTNRKNVIKNHQSNSNKKYDNNSSNNLNKHNIDKFYNYNIIDINDINDINNDMLNNDNIKNNIEQNEQEILKEHSSKSNTSSLTENLTKNESSPDKSLTPLSDYSPDSDIIYNKNIDKRKRKYYRTLKLKKNIQPININEIQIKTPKSTPTISPRDITQDLWNDSVEHYYIEFQKLCKEEYDKYKYLSYRNELISKILKFVLLISGCFTFTLSISIPNSIFMSTTTTISSCLTAIITSLTGFFQFDKKSEIQYNIYRELDKLYNTISLEMLKPTFMRPDPYEYILILRNRRDELLKTLQKK
jgi:hypothetical protein